MALFNHDSHDDYQSVENSAKTLLANIRFMSVDKPIRTMAITSAIPNEGKTFVASNLASAIATSGRTVLIVECDLRRRSMSAAIDVHPQYGIYSVLSDEVPLTTAAVRTATPRMFFLDAEPHIPNPSDLLNSRHFSNLIAEAAKTFDYVIFDTPPVTTFVDAAVLGSKVDATFLVVRENFTKRDEVVRAADQLRKADVNIAGVIMNYCARESSEYYYEYYYKDNKDTQVPAPKRGGSRKAAEEAPAPAAPARPNSWNNAPQLDAEDGDAKSGASAQQQTFRTQGTALTQAVTNLHDQVSTSQRARHTAAPAAPAPANGAQAGVTSARKGDDMSRYRIRTH